MSFHELASAQLPRLYSIARMLVGDDAEDAMQDCLLKRFERYGQLKTAESEPAWLKTILVNSCRDHFRADARRPHEIDFESSRNSRCTARSPTRILFEDDGRTGSVAPLVGCMG